MPFVKKVALHSNFFCFPRQFFLANQIISCIQKSPFWEILNEIVFQKLSVCSNQKFWLGIFEHEKNFFGQKVEKALDLPP